MWISSSDLRRNILTLLKGNIFAQALPILCMPLLTRLYTPESFGIFTLYLSIVLSLASIAGLRYEYGILLPKKNFIAWRLLILAAKITLIISVVIGIIFILMSEAPATAFIHAVTRASFYTLFYSLF